MARNIPIRGDLIIIEGYAVEVFIRDLDGDMWIAYNKDIVPEMIPSRGHDLYHQFENYGFFQDEVYEYLEPETYYTYLPDYFYGFEKLNLTRLARKVYNIPEDFKGEVYIAIRRDRWWRSTTEYVLN